MKSHLGHLCFKASSNWGKMCLLSVSYLPRNMGLTYCCRWTLQGCRGEPGEWWQTIRHRLGSWWLCWLLSLCFTCGWRAKDIAERGRTKGQRENKRTDGGPGPASAGKRRRPGRRTLHKQRSSSVLRGVNLGTIWGKGVNYSSKWNGRLRCVPGEESSLPAQPTPAHLQRPAGMWEKARWVPREHSPPWGHDRLGRGCLPGLRANSHWCGHACKEFQPLGHRFLARSISCGAGCATTATASVQDKILT